MKSSYLVSLLLAVAVVLLSVKVLFLSENKVQNRPNPSENTNQVELSQEDYASIVLHNIYNRTSIRAFTDEPVSEQHITDILGAAMAAPTAGNRQPWRFVVITDRNMITRFAHVSKGMGMAATARLAILICGDKNVTFTTAPEGYCVLDGAAATQNLLLAAHAFGLGAVWCGVYPIPERSSAIAEMMGLPHNIIPVSLVFVGHPAENPQPKDKWNPQNIHYNHW